MTCNHRALLIRKCRFSVIRFKFNLEGRQRPKWKRSKLYANEYIKARRDQSHHVLSILPLPYVRSVITRLTAYIQEHSSILQIIRMHPFATFANLLYVSPRLHTIRFCMMLDTSKLSPLFSSLFSGVRCSNVQAKCIFKVYRQLQRDNGRTKLNA